MENLPDIPKNAKFVIYSYPETTSTMQRTLCDIWEICAQKIERSREAIQEWDMWWHAYQVQLKDNLYNILSPSYIIRVEWSIRNIFTTMDNISDWEEYNAEADREQSQASEALSWTGLHNYVTCRTKEWLIYVAFNDKNMITIPKI